MTDYRIIIHHPTYGDVHYVARGDRYALRGGGTATEGELRAWAASQWQAVRRVLWEAR